MISDSPSTDLVSDLDQASHKASFSDWPDILDWAIANGRQRSFRKNQKIGARSGFTYLVKSGFIRLVGTTVSSTGGKLFEGKAFESGNEPHGAAIVGFVGLGEPFELMSSESHTLAGYAQADNTELIGLRWEELSLWPKLYREVLVAFRCQHQRQLLWLNTLGQRRTADRILGLLQLLADTYGQLPHGSSQTVYCLPFSITHAQIANAVGSTRVTVTRLLTQLRQTGFILEINSGENSFCLPMHQLASKQKPRHLHSVAPGEKSL